MSLDIFESGDLSSQSDSIIENCEESEGKLDEEKFEMEC
jgi:hypothetical protein